jgi:hypothetical protein
MNDPGQLHLARMSLWLGYRASRALPYQLLKEIPAQSFTLLVSVPLFVEYEATLKRKEICKLHGLSHQDVDVLLEVWAKACEPVSLNFLWRPHCVTPAMKWCWRQPSTVALRSLSHSISLISAMPAPVLAWSYGPCNTA